MNTHQADRMITAVCRELGDQATLKGNGAARFAVLSWQQRPGGDALQLSGPVAVGPVAVAAIGTLFSGPRWFHQQKNL